MASGVNAFGKMNADWYLRELKGAKTQFQAIDLINNMMSDANKLGISTTDQKTVTSVLNAYAKQYNVDVSGALDVWDPAKNKLNSTEFKKAQGTAITYLNNNANTKATTNNIPAENKTFSWSANDASNANTNPLKNAITPAVGGGYANTSTPASSRDAEIDSLYARITELENPKRWSAQEIADYYGIDYDKALFEREYNEATNQYYDEAIRLQNQIRSEAGAQNALLLDSTIQNYLDTARNAAPTGSQQGSAFATALATRANAQYMNAQNDTGMLGTIQNLERNRQAEIANNPNLANQRYNRLAELAAQASGDMYKTDISAYNAYKDYLANAYASDRDYQSALTRAESTRYQGLANASIYNAQNMAQNATSNQGVLDSYLRYLRGTGMSNQDADSTVLNWYR